MTESAPLLSDIDPRIDINEFDARTNVPAQKTQASSYFKRPIQILIIFTLIFSALPVVLLITNHFILKHAPLGYNTWSAKEATKELGKVMFVSLIFSIINALVNFPILLNMILDVVLTAYIIPGVVHILQALPNSSWCAIMRQYPWPGNPNPQPIYPHPKCDIWKLVVTILIGISAGSGIIVSVIYLTLLLLRSIAVFRSKLWKRPLTWTIPSGQLSLEIKLNFLKQEGVTTGNVGQSSEADVRHGPVYL
ncbi:hypothetical protein BYT27DRAFT_7107867 [Phlegmacium glaucopus]|nr:hypothetical protein BYT27DRAFT_7107867 [Phlegmacium glaucopus]